MKGLCLINQGGNRHTQTQEIELSHFSPWVHEFSEAWFHAFQFYELLKKDGMLRPIRVKTV